MDPIIFHVDVNSAFLAWNAVWDLAHGAPVDLREIPSVVGGDPKKRRGIVLAKSGPAKKFGIVTGESLYSALAKCPDLIIAAPRYTVYAQASEAMTGILSGYSPLLERYSIDECFLDMGALPLPQSLATAQEIRQRISRELGFTVNVGIGPNKLCAKMASDFEKPDRVHTLFSDEIKQKLHPLPIEALFMVGPALAKKLRNINITTIGGLARCERHFIAGQFGKLGDVIWNFAWGIDSSPVEPEGSAQAKGLGNSTTLPQDLTTRQDCQRTLRSLLDTLLPRLREAQAHTTCVAVHCTTADFLTRRHQRQLSQQTDSAANLEKIVLELFDEIWDRAPVRKLGIAFSGLRSNKVIQLSMLDLADSGPAMTDRAELQKRERLDAAVCAIRERFGQGALSRGGSGAIPTGIGPGSH